MIENIFDGLAYASLGMSLGIFNYLGLWLTVKHLPTARRPSLLSITSFFVRILFVLAMILLATGARPEKVIVVLTSFFLVRTCFLCYFRMRENKELFGGRRTA
ncbi:MAG: ATP synthase subunit I [Nitrospirota bacterium]